MQISGKYKSLYSIFNDPLNMTCKSPANSILCSNITFSLQRSIEYGMQISSKELNLQQHCIQSSMIH
uniref:Uncharacterized protein n=1 Tax=viral metagenome TaxID=1070528 RepID=A0A6C0C9Z1_9ZZZZ